jgi:hypothetical protein
MAETQPNRAFCAKGGLAPLTAKERRNLQAHFILL